MSQNRLGILLGFATYIIWGFMSLFWKLLSGIDSHVVLSYRIIWTCLTMLIYMFLSKSSKRYKKELVALLKDRKSFGRMLCASLLISCNWLIYITAVHSGHATEASLGYYMMPLLAMLLSFFFLGERLFPFMLVAVGFAGLGVLILVWQTQMFPWLSISLALTFGFYGLIKKEVSLSSDVSMLFEAAIVFPVALIYLIFFVKEGMGSFSLSENVLLTLSGLITAVPLLLFSEALKRAPLNTIGFLQYISPTIQLLLALNFFGESLKSGQLLGFIFIWLAILIFILGQVLLFRNISD